MRKLILLTIVCGVMTIVCIILVVHTVLHSEDAVTKNTPEEIYKNIISEKISEKIEKISATGYTFQGNLLYLVIEFNDETYMDELKAIHSYQPIGCENVINELTIPENLKPKLEVWEIPENIANLSCFRASGYSNNWTSAGESVFLATEDKVFFYEIGI